MSDPRDQDRLLNGALRELIEWTVEIGDRKEQSATRARSVEDVAIDEHRMALSDDYRRSVAFLKGVKDKARELTGEIQEHIKEYDSRAD